MKRKIQLVGGPRDGALVPDYGPIFREPNPRAPRATFIAEVAPSLQVEEPEILEYRRERWSGDLGWRYVLVTTDLGQPSFEPREDIW